MQIEGFRRLAEKALDLPEPALIFQILGLQGSYLKEQQARLMCGAPCKRSPGPGGGSAIAGFDDENSRSRACSTSSSIIIGYSLRHSSGGGGLVVRPSETDLPTSCYAAAAGTEEEEEDISSTTAGQGLHIVAFNFVSELLKLDYARCATASPSI